MEMDPQQNGRHGRAFPDLVASAVRLALGHNGLVVRDDNDRLTLVVVVHIDMAGTFDTDDDTVALGDHTAGYSMVTVVAPSDSHRMQHGHGVVVVAILSAVDYQVAFDSDLVREVAAVERRRQEAIELAVALAAPNALVLKLEFDHEPSVLVAMSEASQHFARKFEWAALE